MIPSVNGGNRSTADALVRLGDSLADPDDRERYAELIAYVRSVPPTDELVKVAELFGFLTMMGLALPDAIAAEQVKMREFLLKAYGALQQEVKINAAYHEKLNERLSRLPQEIADGVRPEDVAKKMSESFRQQIAASGVNETASFLRDATQELKRLEGELNNALGPLVGKFGKTARDIAMNVGAISKAAENLDQAARAVDAKNTQLLKQIHTTHWWALPVLAILLVLSGFTSGALWERQHFIAAIDALQKQVDGLQKAVQDLPNALAPAPKAKQKKSY